MHVARLGVSLLKGSAQAHPDELGLAAHGPVGDRRFCVVDLHHPQAVRVLRTVQNPRLVALRATQDADGTLHVHLPDGTVLSGPAGEDATVARTVVADYWGRRRPVEVLDGPWAAGLTAYLRRDVVLARARPRDVVYGGGVTLVTTSTLAELARRARAAGHPGAPDPADEAALVTDAERFRATAVVATPGAPAFVEDGWLGRGLRLGDTDDAPLVRVQASVPRCAVVRLHPGDGRRDPWDPLRLLAADRTETTVDGREVVVGVEAEVTRPGPLRAGAPVVVIDS